MLGSSSKADYASVYDSAVILFQLIDWLGQCFFVEGFAIHS